MSSQYDFCGWATRNHVLCTDGRTILKDAFKHNDGCTVPLVWNHMHNDPENTLGHALLENRDEGVYAYCSFNDTPKGQVAKTLVQHGDIVALSIYANQLKENMSYVSHGNIREVSLVHAGANPEAFIDHIITHGDDCDDEAIIYTGEELSLYHSDDKKEEKEDESVSEEKKTGGEKTVQDVVNSMTEEQRTVMYALIGQAVEDKEKESEGGNEEMKHNVFDQTEVERGRVLSHSDQEQIMAMAKQSGVGSFKAAMEEYCNNNALSHSIFEDDLYTSPAPETEYLFPDYELLKKGEPETLERDQSWISAALAKIHKSPFSRIRTRHADARIAELRAKGYQKKGDEKQVGAQIKVIGRTTDPQTIYIKDDMHRDDIIDMTDFSPVEYQWKLMRHIMNEELALAALVGDGREEGDPDKIHETHIRSIWNDDEMYTIHADVDIEAARKELQGTNTGANFGENYIYAEAIITAALYSREKFKGSGTPDLYCTPHLLNVMLLARDLNGRRIYDSKSDLAAALNVNAIHTVEQFEGKTRTDAEGNTKKLLGLFVNLSDYQFGSTKGGELTKFEDFDMDFNKYKYMLETRLSGSLTKLFSAIALEEPVSESAAG